MKRAFLLLLAASAMGCAHNRPAHRAADRSQPNVARVEAGDSARELNEDDAYARGYADDGTSLQEAPRRANNPANATADGYVSTSEVSDSADPVFTETTSPGAALDADNSGRNADDGDGESLTAADQGTSESDRKMTQSIRKALMADNTLSFNAKNVKVITREGSVTLRGPVNNQKERAEVAEIARRVVGAPVDNQLQVKSE